jgi:hypothetical protein
LTLANTIQSTRSACAIAASSGAHESGGPMRTSGTDTHDPPAARTPAANSSPWPSGRVTSTVRPASGPRAAVAAAPTSITAGGWQP